MSETAQPPAFAAVLDGRMRRIGLEGKWAIVGVRDGALEIHGDQGGMIAIPPGDVERMRIGFFETKTGKSHRTVIWRRGEPEAYVIQPRHAAYDPYAPIIRDFAGRVAGIRGAQAIETGVSVAASLVFLGLMGFVLAAAVAVTLFVLPYEPDHRWWWTPAVLAFPVLIVGYLIWAFFTRDRPRLIRAIADVDRFLA